MFYCACLPLMRDPRSAALAASIVAVHPAGIEDYVWIAGFAAAFAKLFTCASLAVVPHVMRTRGARRGLLLSLGILGVVAGLCSKEGAVVIPALTLALESQPDDVLELFNNTETGILPRLETQLESLLKADVGRLDFKSARLEALSELDTKTEESFQRAFGKLLLETNTRNLIAIA
jgi:hypothetical protein